MSAKFIIPRAKIGLRYSSLIRFIFDLLKGLPEKESQDIINDFESRFAADYNLPPGVVFNKARTAFYFLLKNLGLKQEGEVIISALHVADFVNIIYCAGFKPVVVDLDKDTYAVDYQDLENKITPQTVLLYITHLSGFATDMDRISKICQTYNIPFLEDCSQAYLSYYKGKILGTFGKAAVFSLSFLKPICTMTGGVVLSQDKGLLEKLRQERNQLASGSKVNLIEEAVKHLVYKTVSQRQLFRMFIFPLLRLFSAPFDFLAQYQRANKKVVLRRSLSKNYLTKYYWQQARFGLQQMKRVREREATRKNRAYYLHQHLTNPAVKKPKLLENSQALFWTFPVRTADVGHFKRYLAKHGIDSSTYLLSVLADEPQFAVFRFKAPAASDIKKHTLLLPMYPELSQEEVEYMVKVINQYHVS